MPNVVNMISRSKFPVLELNAIGHECSIGIRHIIDVMPEVAYALMHAFMHSYEFRNCRRTILLASTGCERHKPCQEEIESYRDSSSAEAASVEAAAATPPAAAAAAAEGSRRGGRGVRSSSSSFALTRSFDASSLDLQVNNHGINN